MKCPFCDGEQLFVINSRPTKKETQIWRRKRCGLCGQIFTTYERIDLSYLIVIKKSGKKQRYWRAKIFTGIYNALIHLKGADRGENSVFANNLTDEIENKIILLRKKEISTKEIVDLVTSVLSQKAPVLMAGYTIGLKRMSRLDILKS